MAKPKSLQRKEDKPIHPNSRKAGKITKKASHDARIIKGKRLTNVKLGLKGEKVLWFRDNLDPNKDVCSKGDAIRLVERYLKRFDEEKEQIKLANSLNGKRGRSHIAREDSIRFTLERETREFEESGFEMPDLLSQQNYEYLRDWTGELRFLSNIKMKSVTRKTIGMN